MSRIASSEIEVASGHGAAEKAGVLLGLEDTMEAEDNVWIIDRVGSRVC